jgi:hypothetical protein
MCKDSPEPRFWVDDLTGDKTDPQFSSSTQCAEPVLNSLNRISPPIEKPRLDTVRIPRAGLQWCKWASTVGGTKTHGILLLMYLYLLVEALCTMMPSQFSSPPNNPL